MKGKYSPILDLTSVPPPAVAKASQVVPADLVPEAIPPEPEPSPD